MIAHQADATTSETQSEACWFTRLWAIGLVALTAVSYPLWTPGVLQPEASFPAIRWIPISAGSASFPFFDFILYMALVAICIAFVSAKPHWPIRTLWFSNALILIALVSLDQHRLQPWVYQAILYSITIACCRWHQARRVIIWIAISVYFYSSLGKADFQFAHTVGTDLIQAMTAPLGGVSNETAARLALILPASEFLIAILLVLPKTRRLAGYGVVMLHLSLIAVLGPWSLGHSNGVLVWNIVLAIQAWLLFIRRPASVPFVAPANESTTPRRSTPLKTRWIAYCVLAIAIAAPLTERSGYWDHWTSWALYSPHSSRANIQIHESAFEKLPPSMLPFFKEDEDSDGWTELDLSRWSLGERLVPVYPQARYQLAVALKLTQIYRLGRAIRVERKDTSDRWTGERNRKYLLGERDIEKEMCSYWLHFDSTGPYVIKNGPPERSINR